MTIRRPILVNGIGCTDTGARFVLLRLLESAPADRTVLALVTSTSARHAIGRLIGRMENGVLIIGLSHRLFGRWLRVPLELVIALVTALRLVFRLVNLSHYGITFGGPYILYLHSPLLVEEHHDSGWSEGRPNALKRAMLDSCVRRARIVIVQTAHIEGRLREYCKRRELPSRAFVVMLPRHGIERDGPAVRYFRTQLLYPASAFAHKRAALAIEGARRAAHSDPSIGIVITIPSAEGTMPDGAVRATGPVPYEQVAALYRGSDLLVFTSGAETLGLPLLEALSLGIPVVAPRLPYATELLGDTGWYFDQPEPDAVCRAVLECVADIQNARESARRRYKALESRSFTWQEHWSLFLN